MENGIKIDEKSRKIYKNGGLGASGGILGRLGPQVGPKSRKINLPTTSLERFFADVCAQGDGLWPQSGSPGGLKIKFFRKKSKISWKQNPGEVLEITFKSDGNIALKLVMFGGSKP